LKENKDKPKVKKNSEVLVLAKLVLEEAKSQARYQNKRPFYVV